jgi:hypothetical protein
MKNMSSNSEKLQIMWMLCALIPQYYRTEITGGSCHIVLDDINLDDSSVQFCVEYSEKEGDFFGKTIAEMMLKLDEAEREQVLTEAWKIEHIILENGYGYNPLAP